MSSAVAAPAPRPGDLDAGLVVEGLTVRTTRGGASIVEDVSLEVRPGRVLGLVGESGSGKSTIGVALLGLARRGLRIAAGSVSVGGTDLLKLSDRQLCSVRGRIASYVPQDPATALNPAMRVGTQLREVLKIHPDALPAGADLQERVDEVLAEVGLAGQNRVLASYPHQLSGGQQQRIGIAMAIIARPALVVFDEPTTGLDVTTQKRVLQTIRELTQQHRMMSVYVSHDLAVVAELADDTAVLYAGRLMERAPTRTIFTAARHPYTDGLIRSAPSATRGEVLLGIAGRPPRPGAWPVGCAFADRCERVEDDCRQSMPALEVLTPEHTVRCYHPQPSQRARDHNAPVPAMPAQTGEGLAVRRLEVHYGTAKVLHDVSLDLLPGQCTAVVGESGSGKTTLSRCVAGLHENWSGAITLDGVPLDNVAKRRTLQQRRSIQYVFQNSYGSLNPRMSVGENLDQPLRFFTDLSRRDRHRKILETLDSVALSVKYLDQMPDQLSGGERQRVAVGRSLTIDPELLICDEITSALDVSVQALLVEQLRQLQQDRHLTLLFVTHNLAVVRSIAQRVVVLSEGRVVESGTVEDVLSRPQNPYTQQLLRDLPDIESVRDGDPTSAEGAHGEPLRAAT